MKEACMKGQDQGQELFQPLLSGVREDAELLSLSPAILRCVKAEGRKPLHSSMAYSRCAFAFEGQILIGPRSANATSPLTVFSCRSFDEGENP